MNTEPNIIVQVRLDTAWKTVHRYDGEDPSKAQAIAKQAVAEAQSDEVRILVGRYDAASGKHGYKQLYASGPIARSTRPPASPQAQQTTSPPDEMVVQVRKDTAWTVLIRYEGDDPNRADALSAQVVAEALNDEVRILHGRYDAAKGKHAYRQLHTSGPIARIASQQPKADNRAADAPVKHQSSSQPLTPPSPTPTPINREQAPAQQPPLPTGIAQAPERGSQPRPPSTRTRSRKKMIGIGVAAAVLLTAMGAAGYAWKTGVFEDPKVTGYGVLALEGSRSGVCVEDDASKAIFEGLGAAGKITSVKTNAILTAGGLDEAFVQLKTKGCGSFFGSATSIKKLTDGLIRDHRKFEKGDWVGRNFVASMSPDISGETQSSKKTPSPQEEMNCKDWVAGKIMIAKAWESCKQKVDNAVIEMVAANESVFSQKCPITKIKENFYAMALAVGGKIDPCGNDDFFSSMNITGREWALKGRQAFIFLDDVTAEDIKSFSSSGGNDREMTQKPSQDAHQNTNQEPAVRKKVDESQAKPVREEHKLQWCTVETKGGRVGNCFAAPDWCRYEIHADSYHYRDCVAMQK